MKNVIDMCNYLLEHGIEDTSSEIGQEAQDKALDLCLIHGDRFVLEFMKGYLQVVREETQSDHI